MHDARTIVCGNVVAKNHSESFTRHLYKLIFAIFAQEHFLGMCLCVLLNKRCRIGIHFLCRFHPWHQLLVTQAFQVTSFIMAKHLIRYYLLTFIIRGHFITRSYQSVGRQISIQAIGCQDDVDFLCRVRIVSAYRNIVKLRSYAECRIRRKCPRRGGPCHQIS